jgi:putative MATE family efflux protein
MGIADMVMVGRLPKEKSTAAVAALGSSLFVLMFVLTLGFAIATGAAVLMARRTGEKNVTAVANVSANALTFTFVLCVFVLTPLALLLMNPILTFVKAEGLTAVLMRQYLEISFYGLAVMFLLFICNSSFRTTGDARTPLVLLFAVNAINLFLNWVLIYGKLGMPALEVRGAAVATLLARLFGIVVSLIILWKHPRVMLGKVRLIQFDLRLWWTMFRIGFPNTLQAVLRNSTNLILLRIVAGTSLHGTAVAAYMVGMAVIRVPVFVGLSFMQVGVALVGQNLGAKKPDRAETAGNWAARFSAMAGFIITLALLAFPYAIAGEFVKKPAPGLVPLAVQLYLIVGLSLPFLGHLLATTGCLRGAGDTVSPLVIAIISRVGVLIPLAWVLSQYTGLDVNGVWVAVGSSSILQFTLTYFWWRRGKWKTIQV